MLQLQYVTHYDTKQNTFPTTCFHVNITFVQHLILSKKKYERNPQKRQTKKGKTEQNTHQSYHTRDYKQKAEGLEGARERQNLY